jgi:hypothetical protein
MEVASQYTKQMIETLLNVHALTNMHRSSENDEYLKSAARWLPTLEWQFKLIKDELNKEATS